MKHALACFFLVCLNQLAMAQDELFDGATFDGWQGNTNEVWSIENGVIVGGSLDGNPHNEYLATKKSYKNFHLKLDYKLIGTEGFVNGGIQFRSKWLDNTTRNISGYQADIGHGFSGFIYDEHRRNKFLAEGNIDFISKVEKPGQWNTYEIIADGDLILLFINGQKVSVFRENDDSMDHSGLIALQIHGDCKAQISFRNIFIKELPEEGVPRTESIMSRFGNAQPNYPLPPFKDGEFNLLDNEIIAMIGQENFVREQRAGVLESILVSAWVDKKPKIRSMAWEADTVYEQWRDLNFGDWGDQLDAMGATMIIVQFGQMESLDGSERISEFVSAYHRLLDEFASRTQRIVLVSPMPFEKPRAKHAPDLTQRNSDVANYVEAIRLIAKQRQAHFIDLFNNEVIRSKELNLTNDGIHLNQIGLEVIGEQIAKGLGIASLSKSINDKLRDVIILKNQLWFDCWRPANWSFVYGDRVNQRFGKSGGNKPSLQKAFENQLPLVQRAEKIIYQMVVGKEVEELNLPQRQKSQDITIDTLSAIDQLKAFTVAEGYQINLFASEDDGVINPVQISWDAEGRLYVACSPSYPQSLASAIPSDYILVLEDSNKDGRADKHWKYADKLTMVQGIEPGNDGVYVCDFDKLLHIRDTNGDGVGDEREVLFSGFGIGDTHQLINSICYGPDGSLWFTQGLHAMSRVETPWGIARLDRSAVWRLRPKSLRLEGFFGGGMAGMNCWGVAFDDFNQVFHKSGDRPQGYWSVPGLVRGADPSHTSSDTISNESYKVTPYQYHPVGPLFDTSPKTTSLDIIGTKALPDDIQGTALIAGYFGSVVELHHFHDSGSGFKTTQLPKLVKSSNNAFRPVDVSVGPDGAIYLSDWFNPVIGHYQASYADPKRDKSHGRIWRVSSKNHKSVRQPKLVNMDFGQLLNQLKSSERWTRYQAKKLLFNSPTTEIIRAADQWVKANIDNDHALLEVVGVYVAHEKPNQILVNQLLESEDARIRSYGARIVGIWGNRLKDAYEILLKSARDIHPRVRLESVIAASYLQQPKSIKIVAEALEESMDPFLEYAMRQSTSALRPYWENSFRSGEITFNSDKQNNYLSSFLDKKYEPISPGERLYQNACLACHQPDGNGLTGIYPPLTKSRWVQSDKKESLIKIVLHGLKGKITVDGKTYGDKPGAVPMPPMSGMSDKEISQVLNYVRKTFGPGVSNIKESEVHEVRRSTKSRTSAWTEKELQE